MGELKLLKGNEAISEAAIRCGADGYFGYPITPQSDIMEYLMHEEPYKTTGMVALQAESEIAAIYMIYGGASCGKKVFTSSSSPGISLMMEGISYLAGAQLPCLIVNVVRGGPGLGTIQPSQSDYFQAVKGGGHGDYKCVVLAPASVQEMADFVKLGFELAFKYRNPVMILTDGLIGQMMEKVELFEPVSRRTQTQIAKECPWAVSGKPIHRERNIITSLELEPAKQEERVMMLKAKYEQMEKNEVRFENFQTEDAEYVFIAYGSSARICQKAVALGREENIKIGLLRPITLFPFPKKEIKRLIASQVKGFLSVEMSLGQMIEDVILAVENKVEAKHYGRTGGIVPSPEEVLAAMKNLIIKGGK